MLFSLRTALWFAGVFIAIIGGQTAKAQGYYDITSDGAELYTDTYEDAGAPTQFSCPTYLDISVTLNGYSGSGSASYPNTAHVAVSTPASADVSYTWTREFVHYDQQRGGNCGPISDIVVNWSAGFAITRTQSVNLYSDASGNCAQTNACTNGSPKCPVAIVKDGFSLVPCDVWHETILVVLNGNCVPAGISAPATGPGACSLP